MTGLVASLPQHSGGVAGQKRLTPARAYVVRSADSLATALLQAAVPLMVLQVTGSVAWSGVAFVLEWIPRVVSLGSVGPLIDRVGARAVMVWAGAGRVVMVALVLLALLAGGGGLVLALLGAVAGVVAAMGFVSAETIGAEVARRSDAPHRVQAVLTNIDQAALLLGPLLAGLLLLVGHTPPLVTVCAISAAGVAVTLRIPRPAKARGDSPSPVAAMGLGARVMWRIPPLRWVILAVAALNALMAVVQAVTPALVTRGFDESTAAAGILWSVSAAVAMPAVAFAGRAVGRIGLWVVGATAAGIACLAGLAAAVASSFALYAIAIAVLAAAEGGAIVFLRTVRTALIPAEVFGAAMSVMALVALLPYPVAGALLVLVPETQLFALVGIVSAVCGVLVALCFAALRGHHLDAPVAPAQADPA
ncbi:MFS transporter [Actinopolymorpha pittospori]